MNAEHLHAIARELSEDLAETDALANLTQLRDALQAQVNNPQDPSAQQTLSAALQSLLEKLQRARSNSFSPAWHEDLVQLGIDNLFGNDLAARVTEIFTRNQITPSIALEEIAPIVADMERVTSALNQLVRGFESLDYPAEQLEPGEAEVGVFIPRAAVANELSALGEEFKELKRILAPFVEIATGARPDFGVRAISSSDFGVLLDSAPAVAAFVAVTVERLIRVYKDLLEIRRLRSELREKDVPQEALEGLEAHAASFMGSKIDEIVQEAIDEHRQSLDDGRANELAIELKVSMKKLAQRLDVGYHIEVRAEPPEPPDEDEAAAQPDPNAPHFALIEKASEGLRFLNVAGEPILKELDPNRDDVADPEEGGFLDDEDGQQAS